VPKRPPIHNPLSPSMQARLAQQREVERERRRREYEAQPGRQADLAFYRSPRWRRLATWFLSQPENRLCVTCKAEGRLVVATQTDHIMPRKTHPELSHEITNLQGLCASHHARKTRQGG
jgi:5-methylcytosine-specific restriction protein A